MVQVVEGECTIKHIGHRQYASSIPIVAYGVVVDILIESGCSVEHIGHIVNRAGVPTRNISIVEAGCAIKGIAEIGNPGR